jgi:quercetin dioxygenase-like cupin family protein
MRLFKSLALVSLVVFATAILLAQDPVKIDPSHYTVVLDNAAVRVLRVSYPAGAKSPMHQHPDSIALALTPSKVHFAFPDGKSQDSDMANESALYIPGGLHSPANMGTTAVDALVFEFKAAAAGKAALPASREGLTLRVLAEGPRAMAYRSTANPTFAEAAGTKHDFDQVVVALAPAQMSLAIDGKPAKTSWARGDTVFIGRGVPHEAKNTSGKPIEFAIVAIK